MNAHTPPSPSPPKNTRPAWQRWVSVWHVVFYASLVIATAIALLTETATGPAPAMIGLSGLLGAWYWLTVIRRSPTPVNQARVGLTFLAGALALWYPLAGWHQAYFLVSANYFGMMWAFLPFGWAVAGNVVLMLLILLRSLVTAGQPLSSLLGWPLLSGAFGLGWAVLLALWMRSVMQESQKRQRLIEELEATRQSLAQAERQAGVLEERQRLAREIHDTLAQDFTSIVLHLEAADAALPAGAEPVRTHVSRARETARAGLREARRLVLALRPEPLEDASLPEALRRVAAHWAEEGVPADLAVTGEPVALHPEAEVTLLRAAQEALTNVRKHARAHQVNLTLSYMGDQVTLDVHDDGVGFDPAAPSNGIGLAAMAERAAQLGGAVAVESAPGRGTTVAVSIPEAQL
ncbi:MAG: sensor histidine kinase [Chloroflexi bacterium]|nr:sensor histidine kinase [Chloroflexota bacterium]